MADGTRGGYTGDVPRRPDRRRNPRLRKDSGTSVRARFGDDLVTERVEIDRGGPSYVAGTEARRAGAALDVTKPIEWRVGWIEAATEG